MSFAALSPNCPQCGASLPRQAWWRAVSCPFCHASVTLSPRWVERANFRAAWERAHAHDSPGDWLQLGSHDYRLLARLGTGEHSDVWLAERHGTARLRAVIKLGEADRLAREAEQLRQLQALRGSGSAYFSLRLPQPLAIGATQRGTALALRAWPGFWGSLEAVMTHHPHGLRDPRHAVWLWRRVLELLAHLHGLGWCHGDLQPAHWLIHPADHGVHLVSWAQAARSDDAALDLQQSAWALRAALAGPGDAPPPLSPHGPRALTGLLQQASEDRAWCRRQGAAGLLAALTQAALADFGPPRFVPFDPLNA